MKKENEQLGFALQGIKTEQFAILEENYEPKKEVGLSTELHIKLDQSSKHIGVFLGIEFVQTKKVFIKIVVSCHFKIKEESWQSFTLVQKPKLTVPKDFLAHLAMITAGTTRGMLFAKTEGTQFSKFIIPTLNIAEMIPEDATFEITSD